ncbi:MAG: hypothetical protein ACD_71C00161G0004, partial [uncultured bacterium (gcode 4)]
ESFSVNGDIFYPLERTSSFIKSGALLLPTGIRSYESLKDLLREIKGYVYKYVDTSEQFMKIVPYYILLTYIFDNFPEIPYLRVIGDYGSGKSRFMRVVGSVCYSAIITNGWASVSSLFRIIEKIKGTLILDEADFPFSDTTSDIIKILNNGFQKGNPIMRADGENFEPRAYDVYCPKIIGGRMEFRDKATESRCISEIMKRSTRDDIPMNLGKEFESESETLRNKLYKFRFNYFDQIPLIEKRISWLEGRLNQILNPILSIIFFVGNTDDYDSIIQYFLSRQKEIQHERQYSIEGMIFSIIKDRKEKGNNFISYHTILSDIKRQENTSTLNGRKLGSILKQFHIKTLRRWEGFGLDTDDNSHILEPLYKTFGLCEEIDGGP